MSVSRELSIILSAGVAIASMLVGCRPAENRGERPRGTVEENRGAASTSVAGAAGVPAGGTTSAPAVPEIRAGGASGTKIVVKGSDTLGAKVVPQLAEAFKTRNPSATFEISAEGSSTGIAAVIDRTAEIGMSSRELKEEEIAKAKEKGIDLRATEVAHDGIAVIVNAGNRVESLTVEQVEQIFAGDVTDWGEVGGDAGPISIYTRNTSSGTYKAFQELAMKRRDYSERSQKMAGNEQIAAEVGNNRNGIGYVGLAYLKAAGIKPVKVGGEVASIEEVKSGRYPLSRALYYVTDGEPRGAAKEFVAFTLGEDGQRIMGAAGFVPVR